MKIKNVDELLSCQTIVGKRGAEVVTYRVTQSDDGNKPYGKLSFKRKDMQSFLDDLNCLSSEANFFKDRQSLDDAIKKEQKDSLRQMIRQHGQSKDQLLQFLLGFAENESQNPDCPDDVLFEFVQQMSQEYLNNN